MSKITYAIRYTGPGSEKGSVMYVTEMEELKDLKHYTGYGYCCGCRETLQFSDREAAEKFTKRKSIPMDTHEIVDSVTALKQKTERMQPCSPKSALTGKTVKWK